MCFTPDGGEYRGRLEALSRCVLPSHGARPPATALLHDPIADSIAAALRGSDIGNADNVDFAPDQPLFGGRAVADQRGQTAPAQHHRARLAAVDLDDQILVASDRDE